jgi:hypothetical protein
MIHPRPKGRFILFEEVFENLKTSKSGVVACGSGGPLVVIHSHIARECISNVSLRSYKTNTRILGHTWSTGANSGHVSRSMAQVIDP